MGWYIAIAVYVMAGFSHIFSSLDSHKGMLYLRDNDCPPSHTFVAYLSLFLLWPVWPVCYFFWGSKL